MVRAGNPSPRGPVGLQPVVRLGSLPSRVDLRRSLGSDPMFLQISWRSPAVMEKEKLECQIIILLIANNKIIESINDEPFNSSMICLII